MTTLNQLRVRLETQYLEPVNEETPHTSILSDMTDSAMAFTLVGDTLNPDEESYISPGRPLEINNELVLVSDYNPTSKVVSLRRRGYRDTIPAAHPAATTEVRIPTRWPRQVQLDTLRSAVDALWQPLYAVSTEQATIDTAKYIPLPLSTVRIVNVELENQYGDFEPITAKLIPKNPLDPTTAAVQPIANPYPGSLCLITYGWQITAPTGNDDEIEGLPKKWERIVLAEAAAELLAGVDIDSQSQERITEQIRLEGFPVRSGATITQSLVGFAEYLEDKANKELISQFPRRVRRLNTSLFGNG